MTAFGLFMLVTAMIIGGLALDVANAYMARTQLQAASDAAAHSAIYQREITKSESSAKSSALYVVEQMMPSAAYGNVITADDIQFGTWDSARREFTIDPGSDDAVMVDMSRSQARSNAVSTYFLSFTGMMGWDVRRGSVYETYRPTCFREGMVADGVVDIQSNNEFVQGFCIHSNTHVSVNINNTFETGVIVSMPDIRDLDMPSSGFANNLGLQSSLRDGAYQLRILNQLQTIIDDLKAGGAIWGPDYISSSIVNNVAAAGGAPMDMSDFVADQINWMSCSGNQSLRIAAGTVLNDIVIVTNCKVVLGNNVVLRDASIVSEHTDDAAISGSHVSIGYDDSCAAGGGGSLMTMGGISFSSDLDMHGGQMIAKKDIYFRARANGIEGASIIAGGVIDTTSLIGMGFCGGSGMGGIYEAEYFRMAS